MKRKIEIPESLEMEVYETTIYDFNKIDFRKREAKRFKKILISEIQRLPGVKSIVFTMKHKDVRKLFDTENIILN